MSEALDRELKDEARALLRPAREPLAAPADVKARALRRLALALPIGVGGGRGDGGGETGAPATGGAPPSAAASRIGRALAARAPAWSLLVSFVAGGAITAAAMRPAPGDGRDHAVAVEVLAAATAAPPPPLASVVSAAPFAPLAIASAAPAASAAASAARAAPSIAPVRATGHGALEAERALLDVARTALGRGDGSNALRAAEEHGRKFPHGILAEEREAMSIQALRLLHREDDAQARLERFRGRFPSSLIRPALEAVDGGAP